MLKYNVGDTIRITESFKCCGDWILKQEATIDKVLFRHEWDDDNNDIYVCSLIKYDEFCNRLFTSVLYIPLCLLETHSELVKSAKPEIDPELQKIIDSGNTWDAYYYAKNIAKERVPEIEQMIIDLCDVQIIYYYSRNVAKERIPELEKLILDSIDILYIHLYAKYIIGMSYEQARDYSENYSKTMSIDEYLDMINKQTNSDQQIDELAKFIMSEIPGEPSQNEGAVECAIRLLKEKYIPKKVTICDLEEELPLTRKEIKALRGLLKKENK